MALAIVLKTAVKILQSVALERIGDRKEKTAESEGARTKMYL